MSDWPNLVDFNPCGRRPPAPPKWSYAKGPRKGRWRVVDPAKAEKEKAEAAKRAYWGRLLGGPPPPVPSVTTLPPREEQKKGTFPRAAPPDLAEKARRIGQTIKFVQRTGGLRS